MKNFSPNMLKTFESCPVKFNLKFNEKITVPQNPSLFEKGKKIHVKFGNGLNVTNIFQRNACIRNIRLPRD